MTPFFINVLLKCLLLTLCLCLSLSSSVDNAVISRLRAFRHCSPQPSASVNGYTRRALHTCTRIPHLEFVSQAKRYSCAGEHRSHFTVYPSFVIGSYGNHLVSGCLLQHTREKEYTRAAKSAAVQPKPSCANKKNVCSATSFTVRYVSFISAVNGNEA